MLRRARLGVATRPGYPRERLDADARGASARPTASSSSSSSRIRSPRTSCAPTSRAARPGEAVPAAVAADRRARRPLRRGRGYTEGSLTSTEQARRIAALAQDKLARDVVILDMRPVCSYTDYFVVCTGNNPRQTKAIWDEVHARLKQDDGLLPTLGRRRGARRRGSSPTTSTSCCTSSRPRRASSTGSRTCGATSRRRRPSSHGLNPHRRSFGSSWTFGRTCRRRPERFRVRR